jgi:hypothetical protein
MNIIKNTIVVFIFIISIVIVWINGKLYADNFTKKEQQQDIILQLNFLEQELKQHQLGDQMQAMFPEGFVFTNALYGLSWCEYGIADATNANKTRALSEALFAYHQINAEKAKLTFNATLQPQNGIYYLGWNNYLLSKILLLDSNFANNEAYKKIFKEQCELIVSTLKKSNSPYLQSYQDECWPADMCVAMASISNYNKIFNPKYQYIVTEWTNKVKVRLDPATQLIPHKVNSINGETIEGARGCSISLILRLMAEIDFNFAKEQYKIYQQNFVSTIFGLPSVMEYPKGHYGEGDIDSGPVILGVGFAGTIVSIGTFSVLGECELAAHQYQTINSLAMAYKTSDTKKYIFGQLPITDAFIAWGRSSGLNCTETPNQSATYWRGKFHIMSIVAIAVVWLLYFSRAIFSTLMHKNTIEIKMDKN